MGLISSIRERAGLAVGITAFSMLLFILGGDLLSSSSLIFSSQSETVLDIAGKEISYEEYQVFLNRLIYTHRLNNEGKYPDEEAMRSVHRQTWTELMRENVYRNEFEKIGLTVTPQEIVDLVQGNNIVPQIEEAFQDSTTEEFSKDKLLAFLRELPDKNPEQQGAWYLYEEHLRDYRLWNKYKVLLENTNYVTAAEALHDYENKNKKIDVVYWHIPYGSVSDSLVTVDAAEITAYLQAHEREYQREHARLLSYVRFPLEPSAADSLAVKTVLSALAPSFRETEAPVAFAKQHDERGKKVDMWRTRYAVNPASSVDAAEFNIGDVLGPLPTRRGYYGIHRVWKTRKGKKPYARASNILIKPQQETKKARDMAKREAKEVLEKVRQGADFEEMARLHGTDDTASKGGDMGWFDQGSLVPALDKPIFSSKKTGLLPRVIKTKLGYHIVRVDAVPQSTVYRIVSVYHRIVVGNDTGDAVYKRSIEFAARAENAESFVTYAKELGLEIKQDDEVKPDDYAIEGLENARPLVTWLYGTATVGMVSEALNLNDDFVVGFMRAEQPDGLALLSSVQEEIRNKVRHQKKAKIIVDEIQSLQGALEDRQALTRFDSSVNNIDGLLIVAPALGEAGMADEAIGYAFSMPINEISPPFSAEHGVTLVQPIAAVEAPKIEEPDAIKMSLESTRKMRSSSIEACVEKELVDIIDKRYGFF